MSNDRAARPSTKIVKTESGPVIHENEARTSSTVIPTPAAWKRQTKRSLVPGDERVSEGIHEGAPSSTVSNLYPPPAIEIEAAADNPDGAMGRDVLDDLLELIAEMAIEATRRPEVLSNAA